MYFGYIIKWKVNIFSYKRSKKISINHSQYRCNKDFNLSTQIEVMDVLNKLESLTTVSSD